MLDTGSGKGVLVDFLKKEGLNAFGVDARPRGRTADGIVQGRAEALPFRSESFDFIFSTGLFDSGVYDQDQLRMADEMARVLKPGGVYISFGNLNGQEKLNGAFERLLDEARYCQVYRKKS